MLKHAIPGDAIGALLIVPIGFFFGCCPYLYKTLVLEDRLLRRIFLTEPELWRELGCPRGWRWSPRSESKEIESKEVIPLYGALRFDWLWTEPSWLNDYPDLLEEYRLVRSRVRFWNFVLMPLAAAALGLVLLIAMLLAP